MLILLTVIWGMTFPATRSALSVTDPMQFLALRFMIAVGLSTPFIIIRRIRMKHNQSDPTKSIWIGGSLVGLLLFIGFALQTVGMKYTTASRSGFFTGLLVVLTPPLAWLFRTSKTSVITWVAIPISVGGVYLLSDPGSGGLNFGDWLTIGCAVVFALQMVTLEAVAGKLTDRFELTYVQMFTLMVGAMLWCLIEDVKFNMTISGWLAVGYNGIFGGIIAVWLQTRYQPDVPAGHAALIFILEPVFAGLFAWMLLGELWSSQALMGAGLICAAMMASSFGWGKERSPISPKQEQLLE